MSSSQSQQSQSQQSQSQQSQSQSQQSQSQSQQSQSQSQSLPQAQSLESAAPPTSASSAATDLPALAQLRARLPAARPRIAVVLGSGWGGLVDHMEPITRVPYAELEGFPQAGVQGHSGELCVGRIGSHEVAVMSGRKHAYETGEVDGMKRPLRTLQAFGCDVLVQTNAAGSLRTEMAACSLMVLTDHLNLVQRSPLVGETGSARFVDMMGAYDARLRATAQAVASRSGVALHEGVYAWTLGPQFETPAEIRMFRLLGADAVGMSTVPETIIARRAGMRVLALSMLTNMAAGLSGEVLSHAHTLAQARATSDVASRLLADVIAAIDVDA